MKINNSDLLLYVSPKFNTRVFIESVDGYGVKANLLSLPIINKIIYPNLSFVIPTITTLTKVVGQIGMYYYNFITPNMLGSYIVVISWVDPDDGLTKSLFHQIINQIGPGIGGGFVIGVK